MVSDKFIIFADMGGQGIKAKLNVIPSDNAFVIFIDTQMVSILKYSYPIPGKWCQLEGNLDQSVVNAIGRELDCYSFQH